MYYPAADTTMMNELAFASRLFATRKVLGFVLLAEKVYGPTCLALHSSSSAHGAS